MLQTKSAHQSVHVSLLETVHEATHKAVHKAMYEAVHKAMLEVVHEIVHVILCEPLIVICRNILHHKYRYKFTISVMCRIFTVNPTINLSTSLPFQSH